MIRLIILCSLLAISAFSFAGHSSTTPPDSTTNIVDKTTAVYMVDEGKTMYLQGKVKNALIKFREASVKDPNNWKAHYWIGKCHYVLNNYGYSLQYGQLAAKIGGDKFDEEVNLLIAESYHRLGKLDSALMNYQICIENIPASRVKTLRIEQMQKNCEFAIANSDSSLSKRSHQLYSINSGYDEYNVVMADNGKTLYFTSRRSNTTGGGLNPDD